MMRRTALFLSVFAFALALASCSGGTKESEPSWSVTSGASPTPSPTPELRTDYDIPPWSELVAMYDYDTSEPLGNKVTGKERAHGATVYDIEYQSSGHTVLGSLVIPDGKDPFPVVVYLPANDGYNAFFLPDALALAKDGYAGLVITSPEKREPFADFFYPTFDADTNIEAFVTYVIDVLRGIDLLGTLPEIDAGRIGLVGHVAGADVGAIVAGLDDRIDAYVFMVGEGYFTDWARILTEEGYGADSESELLRYQDRTAVINGVNYVGHNQGAAFLFEGAQALLNDVTEPSQQALFDAAPEPKTLTWYDVDGDIWLGCPRYGTGGCDPSLPVFVDHRAWLEKNV